jgi:hypothetical protein
MLGQISQNRILLSTLTKGRPMKLDISINLDNSSFEDDCNQELKDIFNGIASALQAGSLCRFVTSHGWASTIQDSNGNTVGSFTTDEK